MEIELSESLTYATSDTIHLLCRLSATDIRSRGAEHHHRSQVHLLQLSLHEGLPDTSQ
jgi:hypothetical protein